MSLENAVPESAGMCCNEEVRITEIDVAGMRQVDLPPSSGTASLYSCPTQYSLFDTPMSLYAALDTSLLSATDLRYLVPAQFGETSTSGLPPTSELFGGPLTYSLLSAPSAIPTASNQAPLGVKPTLRPDFFIDFAGHIFDVEDMVFEFYEEKMEFENYDLVINMPGQESVLTSGSFDFFLERVLLQSDIVEESRESDCEFEFIEEKLEFEEHDLALSFPGQESILNGENVSVLCCKLIAWMALESETENTALEACSVTPGVTEQPCEENLFQETTTVSPLLLSMEKETLAHHLTQDSLLVTDHSTHDALVLEPGDDNNPLLVKYVPIQVAPAPSESAPVHQQGVHESSVLTQDPLLVTDNSTHDALVPEPGDDHNPLLVKSASPAVQDAPAPSESAPVHQQEVRENSVHVEEHVLSNESAREKTQIKVPVKRRRNISSGFKLICAKIVTFIVSRFLLL